MNDTAMGEQDVVDDDDEYDDEEEELNLNEP